MIWRPVKRQEPWLCAQCQVTSLVLYCHEPAGLERRSCMLSTHLLYEPIIIWNFICHCCCPGCQRLLTAFSLGVAQYQEGRLPCNAGLK